MNRLWIIFFAHVAALTFGLGGILIALPNPQLWADSAWGADVFQFGMNYGGVLHIVLGALVMFLFGVYAIGWRKTTIFFAVTVALSLSSELIGTGTGWPFGNYEYTTGLGYKVLGRVPFTIPLSWFYIGFASYLLANTLFARRGKLAQPALAVLGGAYLLVVWDLVLDPAMAHEDLPIRFWTWFETGAYFGMPVKNFGGWALTGLIFMGVSRLLWREDPNPRQYGTTLPFMIYLANMIFAMALSLSVDLWEPVLITIVLGLLPAAIAWRSGPPATARASGQRGSVNPTSPSPVESIAFKTIETGAGLIAGRNLDVQVDGLDNVPQDGPVILAARHFHHLYDGCALITTSGRRPRILVALDWVSNRPLRNVMEFACGMVRWPVIVRDDGLSNQPARSAYDQREVRRYLRQATREVVDLLRAGECVVIFPEAYPNVDPSYTPKQDGAQFLPFRPGFVRLAQIAVRAGVEELPVVPVGFSYHQATNGKWQVAIRYGAPAIVRADSNPDEIASLIEDRVRWLSVVGERARRPLSREALAQ